MFQKINFTTNLFWYFKHFNTLESVFCWKVFHKHYAWLINFFISVYVDILGQCWLLQPCEDLLDAGQFAPPYWGVGLLQVRSRYWVPPPQVTEQVCQDCHAAQEPSTEIPDSSTWAWHHIFIYYICLTQKSLDSKTSAFILRVSEIVCLTSHAVIYQSYLWRHIDVQANWRRRRKYRRAPNAIDTS